MITSAQIRAARAILGMKQAELAKASSISLATLNNIERGVSDPKASTLIAIQRALEAAGVEFMQDGTRIGVTYSFSAESGTPTQQPGIAIITTHRDKT